MDKTAIDIVLEGVSNGSITQEDAKILLEAIIQKRDTTFAPVPYNSGTITTTPDWMYDPYRPGSPWYSTNTTGNSNIKTDLTTNG